MSNRADACRQFRGLRLIPINTAAGKGLLTAFMADEIRLSVTDKKGRQHNLTVDSLIAPSDINRSAEGYEAIIPLEIIKF